MDNSSIHNEKELLLQVAEGNIDAYQVFFKGYYSTLTFFANAILTNMMDAEDIVQDTFVKIWDNRQQLSAEGNLKSYLYTLVKNACLDKLRKNKKNPARENALATNTETIDNNEWENAALYEELLHSIIREIDSLPAKYQTIITMYFIQGKSYAQISEKLQLPEATIRKQKERALKMLKNSFINRKDQAGNIFLLLPLFFQTLVTN